MFKKYNDTPAAVAMDLILIGMIFWLGQIVTSPET